MNIQHFCTNDNIDSCVQILCSELEVLDYPLIHYKQNDVDSYVNLLNIIWKLIKTVKTQSLRLNDLTEKFMSFQSKYKGIEESKKKLDLVIGQDKRKLDRVQELLSKTVKEKDELKDKIKEKSIEIKKLESSIRLHKLYSKNFSRRRDQYIEGLQAELQILTSMYKSKTNVSNIRTLNSRMRNIEVINKSDDVLTLTMKKYICNLQDKIQSLAEENVNLRGSFLNIYCQFLKLSALRDEDIEAEYCLKERLINLPLEHIVHDAEENVKSIMEIFQRRRDSDNG